MENNNNERKEAEKLFGLSDDNQGNSTPTQPSQPKQPAPPGQPGSLLASYVRKKDKLNQKETKNINKWLEGLEGKSKFQSDPVNLPDGMGEAYLAMTGRLDNAAGQKQQNLINTYGKMGKSPKFKKQKQERYPMPTKEDYENAIAQMQGYKRKPGESKGNTDAEKTWVSRDWYNYYKQMSDNADLLFGGMSRYGNGNDIDSVMNPLPDDYYLENKKYDPKLWTGQYSNGGEIDARGVEGDSPNSRFVENGKYKKPEWQKEFNNQYKNIDKRLDIGELGNQRKTASRAMNFFSPGRTASDDELKAAEILSNRLRNDNELRNKLLKSLQSTLNYKVPWRVLASEGNLLGLALDAIKYQGYDVSSNGNLIQKPTYAFVERFNGMTPNQRASMILQNEDFKSALINYLREKIIKNFEYNSGKSISPAALKRTLRDTLDGYVSQSVQPTGSGIAKETVLDEDFADFYENWVKNNGQQGE